MKKMKIVTHPGRAHRDEFLACCIAARHIDKLTGSVPAIERRMVGSTDLADPSIWVIDTGGAFNAELSNFDHHQMTGGTRCAFDLVLEAVVGSLDADAYRGHSPWMAVMSIHDNRGAQAGADALGMDMPTYMSTRSAVETAMVGWFGGLAQVHPESPLSYAMREIGRQILNEAESLSASHSNLLEAAAPPFMCGALKVWDLRGTWTEAQTMAVAVINQAAKSRNVDVVLSNEGRSSGYGLYRTGRATAKLDFRRISSEQYVTFVHQTGFYAVVHQDVSDIRLAELIEQSAIGLRTSCPGDEVTEPQDKTAADIEVTDLISAPVLRSPKDRKQHVVAKISRRPGKR